MNGQQAIEIIRGLGVSQAKFARLTGVTPHAITKWANGGPPSPPMVTILRLLNERPELIRVLEVEKMRRAEM